MGSEGTHSGDPHMGGCGKVHCGETDGGAQVLMAHLRLRSCERSPPASSSSPEQRPATKGSVPREAECSLVPVLWFASLFPPALRLVLCRWAPGAALGRERRNRAQE